MEWGVDKCVNVRLCLLAHPDLSQATQFSPIFFTQENSPGEVTSHSGVGDQPGIQIHLLLDELTT